MSELNTILSELKDKEILKNVKLFHVFKDNESAKNAIIVTNDNKTYAFGCNRRGVLGFSHDNEVRELTIVEELCDKEIIDIKNGTCHTFALTLDGKLCVWGRNEWGVLGNGNQDKKLYKPHVNKYSEEKTIIDMSCGEEYSLVLTNDGEVLVWGRNECGQIGNGNSGKEECQLTPYFVNAFNGDKVKSISCGNVHSLALTHKGVVHSWGNNYSGQLGRDTGKEKHSSYPEAIWVNIEKVSCGLMHSLLLSSEGEIYVFGSNQSGELGTDRLGNQLYPTKLNCEQKFNKIASHWNQRFSCAHSVKGLYYCWGYDDEEEKIIEIPKETPFKSFNDILMTHYFGITCSQPIDLKLIYEFIHNLIRNGKRKQNNIRKDE